MLVEVPRPRIFIFIFVVSDMLGPLSSSVIFRGLTLAVAEQIPGVLDGRSRARYREVLAVLVRYGVSGVMENIAHGRISPRVSPKAVRGALCELGPAFIKFGQLLSTREELLSKSFRDELAKLQDETTSRPFNEVRDVIEAELGAEICSLFDRIDTIPIASGSIGQVHRARLLDGTEVAVKVQRAGLKEMLDCDSIIIRQLISRFGDGSSRGDSAGRLVSDFLDDVQSELDYEMEANNLERFAWQFESEPKICVPQLVPSHSGRHILTTTYEVGTKLADISGYTLSGKAAAQSFAKSVLRQIFCFGFFHGDPHADNVIVNADGSIGFYDFGLVGDLSVSEREYMNTLLLGLLQKDADATTAALLRLADSAEIADAKALREDLQQFIAKHRHTYSSSVSVTRLLADILQITAKHRLVLPRGFYLAFKVLATADSVAKKLDPEFDLVRIALPLLRHNRSMTPPQDLEGGYLFGTGADALWRFQDLSTALRTTFNQLSEGQLKLQVECSGLEDVARCYDRANSRLASVLFVAFITLGGYGVIGCSIVSRFVTQRQALVASAVLAMVSSILVLLLIRVTADRNSFKPGRDR